MGSVEKGKEEALVLRVRTVPSLILVLMGYMDWLTTMIGIVYFGAVEVNPFFADIVRTNLVAFTAIKLTTTIFVGLLYYVGDRMLMRLKDKESKSFLFARVTLRVGYVVITAVLLSAILNNIIVIGKTI
jgi:hypothetical protein